MIVDIRNLYNILFYNEVSNKSITKEDNKYTFKKSITKVDNQSITNILFYNEVSNKSISKEDNKRR